MKTNTFVTVEKKPNPFSNNNQIDYYRALVDKVIQLEPND